MKNKAPFRLLYNNDTVNTTGVVSPWHEAGEPFRESMLVASIEEVAGTGVDAYMLSPGLGWVPWWQSQVEPGFYEWWKTRTGRDVPASGGHTWDRYVYEGGDMVKVLVDTCRRLGMAPFVSLRLNDVHYQEYFEGKDERSWVSCRFYCEHPEWHIDPDHRTKTGYYSLRGMNWAVPEVRAYKLALIKELAENYDLTGIELDFLRDNMLFRPGELSNAERIDIVTEFVAQVRAALDARGGERRYLCVRIPVVREAHAATGLDVERLREAGVDMFNFSCWYHTSQQTDLVDFRARLPDAALYQEMTHSTGWHPHFTKTGSYGTPGDPLTSDQQFYTTARLAHARGADGMSLFNFVYYRTGAAYPDRPVTEPPFHVLRKLNDQAFLSRQPQVAMLSDTYYRRQLPRVLEPGKRETFTLDLTAPPDLRPTADELVSSIPVVASRLRLHLLKPAREGGVVHAWFNGVALTPTDDVSRFFGNPFDCMISPPDHRLAWEFPVELVRDGLNEVAVELVSGDPRDAIYLDACIS